jgi:hypothetical protein
LRTLNLSLLIACLLATGHARADESILFVVNQANGQSEISVTDLEDYYFKRKLRWPDGTKVQFIDQKDGSPRKEIFLRLLGQSQRDLDLFWIGEKNFSGSSAPLKVPNDSMVISTVGSLLGAIGYVSGDRTELGKTKQILVKKSQ